MKKKYSLSIADVELNVTVDEAPETVEYIVGVIDRKMRDILNTTANNYIRDKKIEKAEELLRTSTMQVNEICYKVGFTTPSYFIKCFRKKYGMSPNEYANSSH
jgi:AraC-like DNA-binding protein